MTTRRWGQGPWFWCVTTGVGVLMLATLAEAEDGRPLPEASQARGASGAPVKVRAPGDWVLIKAGSFMMGSPESEKGRTSREGLHRVTLTHDFILQTTEVTQGQWEEVMGSNPSMYKSCGRDCPVEQANWFEAATYCNKLSQREGLSECYRMSECKTNPATGLRCGAVSFEGLSCPGYRLPTEAEWEYAARAGTSTATYRGDLDPNALRCETPNKVLDPLGWFCGNSSETPHPVGRKLANAWGLHDMLGNVWEWTLDWFESSLSGPATDPTGPLESPRRVSRGCAWRSDAARCRAAFRYSGGPGNRGDDVGLRPARTWSP